MQKWDSRTLVMKVSNANRHNLHGDVSKFLSEAISEGWEVYQSVPIAENGSTTLIVFLLRRLKP